MVCISRSEMDGDNLKFLSYMNDLVELFNLGIKLCLFKVICRSCGIDYLTPPKRQDFLMIVLPGNYKFASMPLVSVHLVNHLKKKILFSHRTIRIQIKYQGISPFPLWKSDYNCAVCTGQRKNNESNVIATFCGLLQCN